MHNIDKSRKDSEDEKRISFVQNADLYRILNEIADLLELDNANPFRVRAYRKAARVIGGLGQNITAWIEANRSLDDLPGIGPDLEDKIMEIVSTGQSSLLCKLQRKIPPSLTELLKIPGMGPKRVSRVYRMLNIRNLEGLRGAAQRHQLYDLPGFGPKLERQILAFLKQDINAFSRTKRSVAAEYGNALINHLSRAVGVERIVLAGSFRRLCETVGDLDILAVGRRDSRVIECLINYPQVKQILSRGNARASVILKCGLQVDLRLISSQYFGSALFYLTGSKAHNIAVRTLARERGLKINEYGVFMGNKRIAGSSEKSIYACLGLPYIEPELRENQGEIEAARQSTLPDLIQKKDLRGDLHAHTNATDGHDTLLEMALAAKKMSYEYLAITDHSARLSITGGLNKERVERQKELIDSLNLKLSGIRVLAGIEVDILEDGFLDLPDEILAKLDVVVGSIHSYFRLSREKQTARLIKAMRNKNLHIIGHPTGRLLGEREPYDIDMSAVISEARKNGVVLELNSQPDRLDISDRYARAAREAGVLVAINSDAHSAAQLNLISCGVEQARRGWLEKNNVLNTYKLRELLQFLRQRKM